MASYALFILLTLCAGQPATLLLSKPSSLGPYPTDPGGTPHVLGLVGIRGYKRSLSSNVLDYPCSMSSVYNAGTGCSAALGGSCSGLIHTAIGDFEPWLRMAISGGGLDIIKLLPDGGCCRNRISNALVQLFASNGTLLWQTRVLDVGASADAVIINIPEATQTREAWNCGLPLCPEGSFSAASNCTLCPFGTYASSRGSTACSPCPYGSFSASIGAVSNATCRKCPPGSFSANSTGAANCTLCPAGTFTAATGSTACQQCAGGHYCPTGTSSWARLNCGRGHYCPDGSGAPTHCPIQVPPTGGWGALQVQGPAFIVETAHCLNHCFWNFTSGNGMLSKC